jgi:hypothetical protein
MWIGICREEGRAASKSPHKKFGYFLSISQPAVSADIIQIQLWTHPPSRPHTVCILNEPVFWQKSPAGSGQQTAKTWFGLDK